MIYVFFLQVSFFGVALEGSKGKLALEFCEGGAGSDAGNCLSFAAWHRLAPLGAARCPSVPLSSLLCRCSCCVWACRCVTCCGLPCPTASTLLCYACRARPAQCAGVEGCRWAALVWMVRVGEGWDRMWWGGVVAAGWNQAGGIGRASSCGGVCWLGWVWGRGRAAL